LSKKEKEIKEMKETKDEVYNAREAMHKLKLSTTTFYRRVNEGKIPYYKGRKPKLFPKDAIDAMADLEAPEINDKLTFQLSTVADLWAKQEIIYQTYGIEDPVPFKTVITWRKVNAKISMRVNEGEKILGWTIFLPLEEDMILELIEGKKQEKDIPPQAVKKWEDTQISVYISTLEAIPSSDNTRDKVVAAFLIRNTIRWALTLMKQCDIKNWYAIATSREGQAILDALGFKHITNLDGGKRKGYKLNDLSRPAKLLKAFLRSIKQQKQ
jgi:predicted DNA-binding transcriptional regulator AlpA